jgi:cytochrome c5
VRRAVLAAAILGAAASLLAAQGSKQPKSKAAPAAAAFDESLPVPGAQLAELPPGLGKATADAACLKCHSSDMLRQQRLNEKQWAAGVTKMAGWGADVPEAKRDELIAYLVKNFGPDNDRFKPVVTRPTGR